MSSHTFSYPKICVIFNVKFHWNIHSAFFFSLFLQWVSILSIKILTFNSLMLAPIWISKSKMSFFPKLAAKWSGVWRNHQNGIKNLEWTLQQMCTDCQKFNQRLFVERTSMSNPFSLSLSLSLTHTHTHHSLSLFLSVEFPNVVTP